MGLTLFQIISLIFSALVLLGSIIGVYIKLKIDITKLEVKVAELELNVAAITKDLDVKALEIKKDVENKATELASDLMQRDIQVLLNEKNNREDHQLIIAKIDKIIDKINIKK